MSITYGTLAQEVDGKVGYIYPKTDAVIVEYSVSESVKDKIKSIDNDIIEVNERISNMVKGIQYGSIGTKNDAELIDIRVPNYNLVSKDATYSSAGDAIRSQFEVLFSMINGIKKDIEEIKNNINN